MLIKEIELHNFRLYKGSNIIYLTPSQDKNISVISGKNGYGKTTLLMSLVWCLYGKQMNEVDELYNKEISEQGGYSKYIASSLNREAKYEGDTTFSVSITFSDIDIPEIPCREIKITRSFDIDTAGSDKLEILIDNSPNELAKDVGQEIFIRDFILPKEIAKFFFFDAEKIVSLAESSSIEQRKELSKAYAEVLGIKKYEDLRENLEKIRLGYRRESATTEEKIKFNKLKADLENIDQSISDCTQQITELKEERESKIFDSNQLQEKLIRYGNTITVEELNLLRAERERLHDQLKEAQNNVKELIEIAPLAISGSKLLQVANQIEEEKNVKRAQYLQEDVEAKTYQILNELEEKRIEEFKHPVKLEITEFYNQTLKQLIKKHFFQDIKEIPEGFKFIHDVSDSEYNELNALLNNLKASYKSAFGQFSRDYTRLKNDLIGITKKIYDAESKEDDPITREFREKKELLDRRIFDIEEEVERLNQKIGQLQQSKVQVAKSISELSRKIELAEQYKKKDELAKRLINELKDFIIQYKADKKRSLEERIKNGLATLMHKEDFISRVKVDIIDDDIDIRLENDRGENIPKESLSKGEQQLYATALLKGLVEESNFSFPVFIDSPMQKFDEDHAQNIVRYFYPNISDQVVILPLINKEMNQEEYKQLLPHISHCYLINNVSKDKSKFLSVEPEHLFEQYRTVYQYAD